MKGAKVVIPLLSLCFLMGCLQVPKPRQFNTGYFEGRTYFVNQQQQLIQTGQGVQKTVLLAGQSETQVVYPQDSAGWQAEMGVFFEANINKPAFAGHYLVDTTFAATDSLIRISYTAQKPDLRVRWLHTYYRPGDTLPEMIEAELYQKNMLYSSRQEIRYLAGKGYTIRGLQDVVMLGADSFGVDAVFVP